jgi:EAL domain-containing protein (putative c-di-GMP-specific phosphodiesterase class I)
VFQPIASLKSLATIGHESASQLHVPILHGPDTWFNAAFAVDRSVDLERLAATSALRYFDIAEADLFSRSNIAPATVLHLLEDALCPQPLCRRVVVELTEHVSTKDHRPLHRYLRRSVSEVLGYR